jgi:hypothetical protein
MTEGVRPRHLTLDSHYQPHFGRAARWAALLLLEKLRSPDVSVGSQAGHDADACGTSLVPRIPAEVAALQRSSAPCHFLSRADATRCMHPGSLPRHSINSWCGRVVRRLRICPSVHLLGACMTMTLLSCHRRRFEGRPQFAREREDAASPSLGTHRMNETNRDDPTRGEDLEPWERNRRLRQAALDAANAHGNGWRLGARAASAALRCCRSRRRQAEAVAAMRVAFL